MCVVCVDGGGRGISVISGACGYCLGWDWFNESYRICRDSVGAWCDWEEPGHGVKWRVVGWGWCD